MNNSPELPIDALFPAFSEALVQHPQIIIHAPPGAGKSTRLPLWLLNMAELGGGKIYLIQPRRLAAANVAGFLARQLNQPLGQAIGLRTRYQTVTGPKVRIEVMTEGVFIRLLQADPELAGVSCVIFDEFHERSLSLDLGLALCLQCQQGYRDDSQPLSLIAMSATLAADQLCAALPDAKLLSSAGRCYPVQTHYQAASQEGLIDAIKGLILQLLKAEPANMLIFLPGMQEIRALEAKLLASSLPAALRVYALHSALPEQQQRAAIAPVKAGEYKLVLATNVAETSITIEGITVVIDSGYAKVASFDNHKGMSRLLSQRISKASAEQRLGRAGRTAPGHCYRMWSKDSHHSLYDFDSPAIMREDLAPFLLELACWGETDLNQLLLLDKPTDTTLQAARQLLFQLQAIDHNGQITAIGQAMAATGLHPRLAAMCLQAGSQLAEAVILATLLTEPPLEKNQRQADFAAAAQRLLLSAGRNSGSKHSAAQRVLRQAQRVLKRINPKGQWQPAALSIEPCAADLLLTAYPDRVAKQRAAGSDRYLLANGHELKLHPEDHLSGTPWLLVLDYGSSARAGQLAYIHSAIAVADSHINTLSQQQGQKSLALDWDESVQAFVAKERHNIGAITLSERVVSPNKQQLAEAVLAYVRSQGLAVLDDKAYRSLAARVQWFNQHHAQPLPDISEPYLLKHIEDWLPPYVAGVKSKADFKKIKLADIVLASWSWPQQQLLAQYAPNSLQLPTGNNHVIDYMRGDKPILSVRMQECFGLVQTPTIGPGLNLLMELLSPARRPLQLTDDLAGFWAGSYHEVAKEMRGRYPKHFWPEDPATAKATARTKKHMG
ncbi:ATP-dependent helicase HrpB [Dasania sp. GY-MA-18]|uniref:ATP-dependent helicase HrpB n=1 Tax=Dasania phycosphaerae TaxID=2950436 RepID=A0A9J6RIV9_9GAMM|nr:MULTISPECIES: ATP-dependent helicase HrpB [Dasania]MCR8921936.1 ATP-dependent helicase HrpB [Dasania sp. GY-MA-18]MCZ0864364.1 ATP-dependent helicase HrpB [Dasania phycosphaerae]MCZ0868092.1 ATP-dependent helicase HrpB [Dasania phycosphaerae]